MEYRRYERSHYGGHVGHLCGNGNQCIWLYGYCKPHGNGYPCSGGSYYHIGRYYVLRRRFGNAYGQRRRNLPMEYRRGRSLYYHRRKRHLYRNGNERRWLYSYGQPHSNSS